MGRRSPVWLVMAALTAFAAPPRRIVSTAPVATELLYGIGAFDSVVAVSEFCTYPPAAKALPKVGGWSTPSVERILGFRPDLVVLSDGQAPFLEGPLKKLGIHTEIARAQTLQDAYNAMETLGKATGREKQAGELAARTRAALEVVRRRSATLPHPTVVCIVDRTPGTLRDMYAVLPGSFLAELIEIAGGTVVGGSARGGYGRISKETILTADPGLILDVMAAMTATTGVPEAAWRELPELKAVKRGNVHAVLDEFVTHDSQMVARTALLFAHLLHPEVPPQEWEAH